MDFLKRVGHHLGVRGEADAVDALLADEVEEINKRVEPVHVPAVLFVQFLQKEGQHFLNL